MYIRGISIDKIDQIYEVLNDREILKISKKSCPSISLLDSLIIHRDSIYLEIYNQNVVNVDKVNPNIRASLIFKKESPCIKGKFSSDCYQRQLCKIEISVKRLWVFVGLGKEQLN